METRYAFGQSRRGTYRSAGRAEFAGRAAYAVDAVGRPGAFAGRAQDRCGSAWRYFCRRCSRGWRAATADDHGCRGERSAVVAGLDETGVPVGAGWRIESVRVRLQYL